MSGLVSSRWHISGRRAGSSTSSSISRPTWTLRTPLKPSAGSARSTAWPCGSRIPALGRTRTRARTTAASGPRAGQPGVERLPGDPLVRLDVLLTRARDDLVGDRRRRRGAVPPGRGGPVADELLVEARLAAARLVLVRRPEPRGVRRADLIADCQRPGGIEPQLELGVGEDDPAGAGVLGGEFIQRQRHLPNPLGQGPVADELGRTLKVD